jgi:proteasome assembly chaperone (PAC2) family protein
LDIYIEQFENLALNNPIAIVGSPGMRSIGKLVVDKLIEESGADLVAELFSSHLPVIYETKPSFAAHPSFPGLGGAIVLNGDLELPKVQFYAGGKPSIVFTKGYHANFSGQYDIAEKVVDFLSNLNVRRIIVIAGYGSTQKNVCCAATKPELISEMKERFNIEVDYKGPFYGFSGLVFGIAKLKSIDALCLFAGVTPNPENPESPDEEAAQMVRDVLTRLLKSNDLQ